MAKLSGPGAAPCGFLPSWLRFTVGRLPLTPLSRLTRLIESATGIVCPFNGAECAGEGGVGQAAIVPAGVTVLRQRSCGPDPHPRQTTGPACWYSPAVCVSSASQALFECAVAMQTVCRSVAHCPPDFNLKLEINSRENWEYSLQISVTSFESQVALYRNICKYSDTCIMYDMTMRYAAVSTIPAHSSDHR